MAPNTPTIASILQALAAHYDGPVAEREVMDRVLERRPSRAKDPYASIRERLRWEGPLLGWVRMGGGTLLPLRVALRGLRFRCIPSEQEVHDGQLDLRLLAPFVLLRDDLRGLVDAANTPVPFTFIAPPQTTSALGMPLRPPLLDLGDWYAANAFVAGDSIVASVVAAMPLTLRIEREPAAHFGAASVAAQDRELLEAIWAQVRRAPNTPLHSAEVVLPLFASASWRGAYPGTPWQLLVQRDRRIQLLDGTYLLFGRLRLPGGRVVGVDDPPAETLALEASLLTAIDAVQTQLRASRQRDAEAGLWEFSALKAATRRSDGDETRLFATPDESPDPEFEEWDDEGWDGLVNFDALEGDDPFEIENPELLAASERLMAALPPDEARRLEDASPEEAELIVASHLNELLVSEPSLFATIVDANAPGEYIGTIYLDSLDPSDVDDDDDSWEDEDWEVGDEDEDEDGLYSRSDVLMRQFYDFLRESGKSESTATSRARDLLVYADFLAHSYGRSLDDGDYVTLDECLFSFYPRRLGRTSPRTVREVCTSIKQFYAFLKGRSVVTDDSFAQAIWRRREEAARVIELYHQISEHAANPEPLLRRLFAPYMV
ncbi:MAG: hypothetical protein H7Y32_00775 [Chloroflexales bacterium]|nr:hypothetical protein [Chloroflexales bacterium]